MISTGAYFAILAALGAERVLELIISNRNAGRAIAAGAVESGRRHYAAMAAFHALFIASAAIEAIIYRHRFPAILEWIALSGAVLAQMLRYWAVATLGARWNTRIITDTNARPVTAGPYRFIRHPNYLAVIIEMACVPLIHGCWITAIVFSVGNAVMLVIRIRTEEAALGDSYMRAMRDLPRFIPMPHRARSSRPA